MGTSDNTIKRNRKILQSLNKQILRLGFENSVKEIAEKYIFPQLVSADLLKVINIEDDEAIKDILDIENILIELVKLIGIMEVSFNKEEFEILINNREEITNKKPELNNFDKLLKGIMKVPKPKE